MKTKPISIRFDKDKLEFVKDKERLPTNQKVVDFLIDRYWWEQKLPTQSIVSQKIQPIQQGQLIQTSIPSRIKSFQDYLNEISQLEYEPEFRKLWEEIQKQTHLTDKQKQLLKTNMNKSNL